MRRLIISTTSLAAIVTASVVTAGPFFQSRVQNQPTVKSHVVQQPAPARKGWSLPKLWGKSEPKQPEPQLVYQPQQQQQSTGQKIVGAISNNPVSQTVSGWTKSDDPIDKIQPKDDPLSLSRPVGPPTPELYISVAQMHEAQGNLEAARQNYGQALSIGPSSVKTLREVGHFEDRQGNLEKAEQLYKQATVVDPQHSGALNDLALCVARQGRLDESAAILGKAIELNPQKPLYRNNLATVYMELGDQQSAMQQLLAAHPPAVAFFNMGHLLTKGGDTYAAADHFAEALRIDPSMTAAKEKLAELRPTMTESNSVAQTPAYSQPAHPSQSGYNPPAYPNNLPGQHDSLSNLPQLPENQPASPQLEAPQRFGAMPGATPHLARQPRYTQPPVQVPAQPAAQPTPRYSAPAATPAQSEASIEWPSEPVTPVTPFRPSLPVRDEPNFGPKLLPPVR